MKILSVRSFADLRAMYGNTVEQLNQNLKLWLVGQGEAITGINPVLLLEDNEEYTEDSLASEIEIIQPESTPENHIDRKST